jgi:hypothetical protein
MTKKEQKENSVIIAEKVMGWYKDPRQNRWWCSKGEIASSLEAPIASFNPFVDPNSIVSLMDKMPVWEIRKSLGQALPGTKDDYPTIYSATFDLANVPPKHFSFGDTWQEAFCMAVLDYIDRMEVLKVIDKQNRVA